VQAWQAHIWSPVAIEMTSRLAQIGQKIMAGDVCGRGSEEEGSTSGGGCTGRGERLELGPSDQHRPPARPGRPPSSLPTFSPSLEQQTVPHVGPPAPALADGDEPEQPEGLGASPWPERARAAGARGACLASPSLTMAADPNLSTPLGSSPTPTRSSARSSGPRSSAS
jgi:hypothetical protein